MDVRLREMDASTLPRSSAMDNLPVVFLRLRGRGTILRAKRQRRMVPGQTVQRTRAASDHRIAFTPSRNDAADESEAQAEEILVDGVR